MSDTLPRAAGSDSSIVINGKTYFISPLDLDDLGALENELLKKRKNPIRMVAECRDVLDDETYEMLMKQAYSDARKENRVSQEEIDAFLLTTEGMILATYKCVFHKHPGLEFEFFKNELLKQGEVAMQSTIDTALAVSGLDETGNSTGSPTAAEAANQGNHATGDTSSAGSPTSTNGDQKQ